MYRNDCMNFRGATSFRVWAFKKALGVLIVSIPGLLITFLFQNCSSSTSFQVTRAAGASFCADNPLQSACLKTESVKCSFDGKTIGEGGKVEAFLNSTVIAGKTCQSEFRVCHSGSLSGSFNHSKCVINGPAACLFDGRTISSSQSVTAYLSSTVPAGQTCQAQERSCNNGQLSGVYSYASCKVAAYASCLFNGQTIAHGTSVNAFPSASVAAGKTCSAQTRTCYNGALSGSGEFGSCVVAQPKSCVFNGQMVASGQSVVGFTTSTVSFGKTCQPITRTCADGVLSGAGDFGSCVVDQPVSCLVNGLTVAHNASVTLYQTQTVLYGGTCQTEVRTCSNGSLSGTATFTSCVESPPTYTPVTKFIDATQPDAHGLFFDYAYAPSIVNAEGVWHMYFCSGGASAPGGGWDAVRHSISSDGVHWSVPSVVVHKSNDTIERATCDPSVVYFDAGDGPFYYLYYSGNAVTRQTVNFVSRSPSPNGPFLKYTQRGTWEENAADPQIITQSASTGDIPIELYGVGQPTVVALNGQLFMWYSDDTVEYPNPTNNAGQMMRKSVDGIHWGAPQRTNVANFSLDVKWDPTRGQFVMYAVETPPDNRNTTNSIRTSKDGVNWSNPINLCGQSCPQFANNNGASSDREGHLLSDATIFAFAAPTHLNDPANNGANNQAIGAIYGAAINLKPSGLYASVFQTITSANWSVSIRNLLKAPGRCVGIEGNSGIYGALANIWSCAAGSLYEARKMGTSPSGNPLVQLISKQSGLCLDIKQNSMDNNARINQWGCYDNMSFELISSGQDNSFLIKSQKSGKCLDIAGNVDADGTQLNQFDCSPNMLWSF